MSKHKLTNRILTFTPLQRKRAIEIHSEAIDMLNEKLHKSVRRMEKTWHYVRRQARINAIKELQALGFFIVLFFISCSPSKHIKVDWPEEIQAVSHDKNKPDTVTIYWHKSKMHVSFLNYKH